MMTIGVLGLLMIGCVSAVSVDFFYSENCGHCKSVFPFMTELSKTHVINFLDVNQGSYNVDGVPTIRIKTSDCRNIELVGSQQIPQYLECELAEMSSEKCPTYSVDEGYNQDTHSWFIR